MALLSSVGIKIVFIVVVAHCSFFSRPTTVYYHITELDRRCGSQQIVKTGNGFDAVYCLSVLPLRNLALRASAPHAPCAWSTRLRAAVRCINEHDIGVLARRDISGHDDANLRCLLYPPVAFFDVLQAVDAFALSKSLGHRVLIIRFAL